MMRKLAIGILATIWILSLSACLYGTWLDKNGFPSSPTSSIGDIL